MGAERLLRFSSPKERERCRLYLASVEGFLGVEGEFGCWLDWVDKPTVLEVGYQMCDLSSGCADAIGREIAKRFKLVAVGADSIGWYKEPPPPQRAVSSWVEWLQTYSPQRDERWYAEEPARWDTMDTFVTEFFRGLDQGGRKP